MHVARHQLRHVDTAGGGVGARGGGRVTTVDLARTTEKLLAGHRGLLLTLLAVHQVTVAALLWIIYRPLQTEDNIFLSTDIKD